MLSATRDYLNPEVLASLAGLPLSARRPMRGTVSGRHISPTKGSSVEFAQYRRYVPGDDLRRLDWRAHGRSDRYYVKEFEADTNLRLHLIVDTSGSMDFGTLTDDDGRRISKWSLAKRLVATLAYLAIGQGDAVGLSAIAGDVVADIPARRSPVHLSAICDTLDELEPQGETRLADLLHRSAETISSGAMVVVLSDFFEEPETLRGCFEHLRFRRHDLSLFHLLDPQEVAFEFDRPTRFVDMEGGTSITAEPDEIADRYRDAMSEYLRSMGRITAQTAADYHRVTLDDSPRSVLADFLTRRLAGGGVR